MPNENILQLIIHLSTWLGLHREFLIDNNRSEDAEYLSLPRIWEAAMWVGGRHSWTIQAARALGDYYGVCSNPLAADARFFLDDFLGYALAHDTWSSYSAERLANADAAAYKFWSATKSEMRSSPNHKGVEIAFREMLQRAEEERQLLLNLSPQRMVSFQPQTANVASAANLNATAKPFYPPTREKFPAIWIDLSRSSFANSSSDDIRNRFDQAVDHHEETRLVKCGGLKRNSRNPSKVQLLLQTAEDEEKVRKDRAWLGDFPGAYVCDELLHPVRVDGVKKLVLFDNQNATTLREDASKVISEQNAIDVVQLRWLSKYSWKPYGSAVIYLTNKNQADDILKRKFIWVGDERAYTAVFIVGYQGHYVNGWTWRA